MDAEKKTELIAEIEKFKTEALKMHIVQVLADSYTNTSLFDYTINSDGSVIWYKAQARQLWDFWQTKTVCEGFALVKDKPVAYMVQNESWTHVYGKDFYEVKLLNEMPEPKFEGDTYDIEIPLYAIQAQETE